MKPQGTSSSKIFLSAILCGVMVLWSLCAFGEEWTAEQKEVWDAVMADVENFKTGNLEEIMSARHDNVSIWWGNKPLPFAKKMLGYNYNNWFSYDIPTNWELEPLAINIIGNVATVSYNVKYSGSKSSGKSRAMVTWMKQDNKWLLINSFGADCDKLPPCNW